MISCLTAGTPFVPGRVGGGPGPEGLSGQHVRRVHERRGHEPLLAVRALYPEPEDGEQINDTG